jgi:RimJ/RimL family protein N-acetyltransferase
MVQDAQGSDRGHPRRDYFTVETLRNGVRVVVRALRPTDRDALLAAVRGMSDKSVYRRFFAFRREFSDSEVSRFVDVDFRDHVALVAVVDRGGDETIAAGARYVTIAPGRAEVASAVTDEFQGQGLGKIMFRHLCTVAQQAGVSELVAEVLPENLPMLKVFERSGFPVVVKRSPDAVHVTIQVGRSGVCGSVSA